MEMLRYELNVPALYEALDHQRAQRGISWAKVSSETGLAAPVFSRLKMGRSISADYLVTLAMWLDVDPREFRLSAGEM